MKKIEFDNACYEVLEILKYVKKEDISKIPEEDLMVLRNNANMNHNFKYNPQKKINEQNVSKLAKGIIAEYFFKYTASDIQREKIELKQKIDLRKIEEEKRKLYNTENLFKKEIKVVEKTESENTNLIEYNKDKWFVKLLKKIFSFFKRKKY